MRRAHLLLLALALPLLGCEAGGRSRTGGAAGEPAALATPAPAVPAPDPSASAAAPAVRGAIEYFQISDG